MITEQDLQEAIAKCKGEQNPNANTCVKLAAFYIINDHMFGGDSLRLQDGYSKSDGAISRNGDSEFSIAVNGMPQRAVLDVIDELMDTLQIVQPRLYAGVIRKIRSLAP